MRINWIVPVFLIAVAGLAAGVWRYGYGQALDQLARRAESDLALASDRLSTQLRVFQELAVLLVEHPALSGLEEPGRAEAADEMLLGVSDKIGAMGVVFADASGHVQSGPWELLGREIGDTPYFRRAMQGALGSGHGQAGSDQRRAYVYAAPAFGVDGRVRGALVMVADVVQVEQAWRGDNPAVFFTDSDGGVFISNRTDLLGWRRPAGQVGLVPPEGAAPPFAVAQVGPVEIWRLGWGPYLPARALHMAKDLPVIGLTGEVLVDVAPALRLASLQAAAVAAICLAFGAMLFLATVRRRTLAEANAVLEARVAKRTEALLSTNAHLRREVREREEAEEALKRAQAELVQAGKLSALGQMSAGISHELNQPLMAIRSFAENAVQFLERDRPDRTAENLTRISQMADRMARIIQNLRAFARQESVPQTRVDVTRVVASAVELTQSYLRDAGVTLDYQPANAPVWVRGGEVRLGQVFVNLITNAVDAMSSSDTKRLSITIDPADPVRVQFRDTGPGIEMPDKVFDPFYTTKSVGGGVEGAMGGMGLGLSISYGIVQSFGGGIRGTNLDAGGAMFSVTLERADTGEEGQA